MNNKDLSNNFTRDILEKKKILILIGSGMSLNTAKGTKRNGIGSTSYYTQKFDDYITRNLTERRFKETAEDILLKAEKSNSQYSALAEYIIKTEKTTNPINKIFREDIIPILNVDTLKTDTDKTNIELNINQESVCKNISLNEGFEAFGLISNYLSKTTRIISSNFDPFIEISFKKNGTDFLHFSYSYDLTKRRDIKLSKDELIIEHYHGYWLEDTAHSKLADRRHNVDYFKSIINKYDCLYVFGFGGWQDAFSEAIKETIQNTSASTQIHWSFFKTINNVSEEYNAIKDDDKFKLIPLLKDKSRSKSSCYYEINTNTFFTECIKELRVKKLEQALSNYMSNLSYTLKQKGISSIFENILYKTGTLNLRNIEGELNISEFIINNFSENKSSIICSKFGLGKTTVLENIFLKYINKRHKNFSILLNLAHYELSDLVNGENSISKKIFQQLGIDINKKEETELINIINIYLKEKKILLILDSIDESIFKSEELDKFREKLIYLGYPLVTSIRLEFHDFIDNAYEFNNWNYSAIEILEWTNDILKSYLNEKEVSENIANKITNLNKLNKRPLFISLLLQLKSLENITDNVASLYYQVIYEILNDLFKTKENKKVFISEFWHLLNSIAISIYLEFQHYKLEINYKTKPKVTFIEDNIRFLASKNRYLDFEKIKQIFQNNEITSKLIKRIPHENSFTFFHRSLFEYLVANGAAYRIIKDAKCSEAWDVFQTDEVSEYFVQEVERENVKNDELKKSNFFEAFDLEFIEFHNVISKYQVLLDFSINFDIELKKEDLYLRPKIKSKLKSTLLAEPIITYSERLEEVLYYIGKFKSFWSNTQIIRFSNYCKFFFYNSRLKYRIGSFFYPAIDPIYYRTSAITLSRLIDNRFIYDYLSFLFSDYITPEKQYFYTQVRKDTKYYGKEQLQKKCLKSYTEILAIEDEKNLSPLQILKTFSLCISICYRFKDNFPNPELDLNKDDFNQINNFYISLKEHSDNNKFPNFNDMLEGISFILRDISFDTSIQEIDFENNLKLSIIKRDNLDLNVFRIVNSIGDGLANLEIDYYNGHIIIEAKKEYYFKKKEIIATILKENLKHEIESISIKHNIDFELSSKSKGEIPLKVLEGNSNKIIDCKDIIQIKVTPEKNPKTGFFIDNRKIRNYIAKNCSNKKVLNLCSFTCTLGAIAKKNGATKVINVDKESKYLELGKKIYKTEKIKFTKDEFIEMTIARDNKISSLFNEKFDMIILDLPEIAPIPCNYRNTSINYKANNLDALALLNKEGILITSCCSHGFSRNRFKSLLMEIIKESNGSLILLEDNKLDDLVDHPVNKEDSLSDYLKIYVIKKIK